MSTDIESLGLLFEIQWKKKPGGNNRDDVASIGIWDTPNASLDWVTFKSYVVSDGNVVLYRCSTRKTFLEYFHLIKVASEGRSGDSETFSCICRLNEHRTSRCKFRKCAWII